MKAKSRQWLPALTLVSVCIVLSFGIWWFNQRAEEVGARAAVPELETASISTEPELEWESDAKVLNAIRKDLEPLEARTKEPWDIEPIKK